MTYEPFEDTEISLLLGEQPRLQSQITDNELLVLAAAVQDLHLSMPAEALIARQS